MAGTELFLPDFTLRHADGREALVSCEFAGRMGLPPNTPGGSRSGSCRCYNAVND